MTQSNNTKPSFQIDPCDNTITLVRGNTCPLKITPTQEIEGVKSPYISQEGLKLFLMPIQHEMVNYYLVHQQMSFGYRIVRID